MSKYILTEEQAEATYSKYSNKDLYNECVLVRNCFNFLMEHEVDSHLFDFLDLIESAVLFEIVTRFGKEHVTS